MPFSEKQQQFFLEASHRWNFKTGATRSGKTYMDYFLIPKRIRARAGKDGLCVILGVSKNTIERNILEPMRNLWPAGLVGRIGSNNTCQLFGETVHCLGAEKVSQVSKLRGTSVKYCYGDEVADWSPEVFELLKSRLDKPYSCFDGALNPQGPNHWLKAFLESGADIYDQKYTIFDNPFLPPGFVENLCKEYEGTVYYQRYILGEWALAEGLIYPMYAEALQEPPSAKADRWVVSLDYGTQNAFAALLWAHREGVWYCEREYYYSGRDTGRQKTDEEYASDLDRFLDGVAPGEEIRTIIDPSAASFITLLRKRGGRYRVIPADNAVADGIRETATCMRLGRFKISPACKALIRELQGYAWDPDAAEDKPVKVDDHACDALRYFVKTMNVVKPASNYVSVYLR
jgi:PBSX family phage terminase large subunit